MGMKLVTFTWAFTVEMPDDFYQTNYEHTAAAYEKVIPDLLGNLRDCEITDVQDDE